MHKRTSFTTSKHQQQLVPTSMKPLLSSSNVPLSLRRNLPQIKGYFTTIREQAKECSVERESSKEHNGFHSRTGEHSVVKTSWKLEAEVERGQQAKEERMLLIIMIVDIWFSDSIHIKVLAWLQGDQCYYYFPKRKRWPKLQKWRIKVFHF